MLVLVALIEFRGVDTMALNRLKNPLDSWPRACIDFEWGFAGISAPRLRADD